MIYRIVLVLALGAGMARAEVAQEELDHLDRLDLPGLEQRLLEAEQPDSAQSWLELQRQRFPLLRRQGQWQRLLEESGAEPPFELDEQALRWLAAWRAEALIGLGRGDEARALLRSLLWSDEPPQGAELAHLRRLVVAAYLAGARYDDAHTALLRYRQDHPAAAGEAAGEWPRTAIATLILSGHPEQALALARRAHLEAGDPHLVWSRLAAGEPVAAQALIAAIDALPEQHGVAAGPLRKVLEAAPARLEGAADQALALEHLLATAPPEGEALSATAQALWQAYEALGKEVANRHQLLVGEFGPWHALARELASSAPLEARALDGWLILNGGEEQAPEAHRRLGASLDRHYASFDLLAALYLASGRFPGGEGVPLALRYRLLDNALTEGDRVVAGAMVESLPRPADIQALVEWQLRRARLQVLEGDAEYGAKLLVQLARAGYDFDPAQRRAYLSVYHDLRQRGLDGEAYAVADAVADQLGEAEGRRELLWWLAGRDEAEGRPLEAARHYLAATDGAVDGDPLSARSLEQAARTLARAGLVEDARHLYRHLLAHERDPERRARLRFLMQRLRSGSPR